MIGTVVGDRYRVVERLGTGGMATVYRGEHQLLRKGVAIKILLPEVAIDADMATRFEAEAIAAARLDHPNCVGISDFGRTPQGQLYLVMELIDGQPLSELVGGGKRLEWDRATEIARQLLRGLARAHELGIIHRDLKPANVMLSKRQAGAEMAKIIDFGIAKMISGTTVGPRVETKAGTVFGTADFIAPERLLGQGENDPRSDLYSVGVVLYEMVTGVRPFADDDAYAIVRRAITEEARPPSQVAPDAKIPAALESVILRALEKDPQERFAAAREFLAALDIEELRTAAHPVLMAASRAFETEVFSRQQLAARKRRWIAYAAGAGVLLLLLVIAAVAGSGARSGTGAFVPLAGGAPASDAAPPPDVKIEVDRLAGQAGEGETLEQRQSAADRLVALGYADRVPRAAKLSRDLHQTPSCEKRLEVLEQLEKLKDPKTLTAVRMAEARPDNDCLEVRAAALVALLETPIVPDEPRATTPPPAGKPPAGRGGTGKPGSTRKKSTRGGHF